jgi:sugar/nucleoside kinase (ribokinase family)
MKFLCVGAAVQDVFLSHSKAFTPVYEGDQWFERLELGGKFDVNKIDFSTGGGATNAAVTFARQGHQAVFIGTVGRDPAGDAVILAMDQEGVDTRHASYSQHLNTAYSVILLAPNGERTILTYRGASTHYEKKHFNIADINGADWLYVTSLGGKMDILRRLFLQAKAKQMQVAFNPGKKELAKRSELLQLLPLTDVLLANREEMLKIVPGNTMRQLITRATKLVPIAVVTDGPKGSVASDGSQIVVAGLYDSIRRTIDRTGAGDAFGSGFVAKLAEGKSLAEAVHFGSANANEVCQTIGAKTNILRRNSRIHAMPIAVKDF